MDDNENKKHFGPGFLGAFATDQRFHDYILRDFCGCGAYGEVWQAEDISGRRLAIKIVSKQIYGSGWTREFNGIKNYCRLISSHPNLIQIMHVGEDDQYFFYTMELADNLAEPGRAYYADTLADRLAANGPFASDQLVILTQHLLNGIGALHQAGLIHRDIKPANIIFINGVPKLSDIGFVAPRDASISLAGTVGFIPPEELLSENGSSSEKNCQYDIYALGKVMYCALTGLPPDEYPSLPESISFGLSKRLNQVICMACCKNPADRIASVDEFRQLLMAAANGGEKLERHKNSKPSGDLPQATAAKKIAAAAIILMVIIILGGMFMLGGFFMLKDQTPKNINSIASGDKSTPTAVAANTTVPSTVTPPNAVAVQQPANQAVASGDVISSPVQAPPLQQPEKKSNRTVPELNMQMIYIEPGTFIMGEGASKHRVTISRDFWIGKYEVTQQEYQKIMGGNPSVNKGDKMPVEFVSWGEAADFCEKLTGRERNAGRLPEGYVYRMPTQAEWEYAARGGNKSKNYIYSGDNNIDAVAWHKNNSGGSMHEVGSKPPNELGLYDMSGNVWELCLDWYGAYSTKEAADPVNLVAGKNRVMCGGCYSNSSFPGARSYTAPENKHPAIGFRVVLAAFIPEAAVAAPAAQVTAALQPAKTDKDNSNRTVPELNMQMVYIEPGTFIMGEGAGKHRVTISKSFWLGKYEVTQQEYQKIMGGGSSANSGSRICAESVSWNDAMQFCEKLTARERSAGRLPAGYVFRLPTEAEWEYAARGGNKSKGYEYSGGSNINDVAWYADNSGHIMHEAGTKLPNELGIYDMSGNQWELCLDSYAAYSTADAVDPVIIEARNKRILRGGSWRNPGNFCTSAFRWTTSPEIKASAIDFRVVLAALIPGAASAAPAAQATAAPQQVKEEKNYNRIVPELNMQMVYVDPGIFMMGEGKSKHRVTISRGLWIGKYEVTQQEYEKIMGSNPSQRNGKMLPVECASWSESVTFCEKLTELVQRAGKLPDGYVYRLPTAAEWEYAARGGNKSKGYEYCGGNDIDTVAWHKSNAGETTHEVGTKLPNELGIYDMAGNVWELCLDWYGPYSTAEAVDPVNIVPGKIRVACGGGYLNSKPPGYHGSAAPERKSPEIGFRVVLAAPVPGTVFATAPAWNKAVEFKAQNTPVPQPVRQVAGPVKDKSWSVPELGMELLYIRPGSFMMGSTRPEREWATGPEGKAQKLKYENDEPEENTIQDAFWMGRTKVTVGQWRKFIDAAGYRTDAEKRGVAHCFDWQSHAKWMWMPEKNWRDPNYSYPVQDNFPVTCVSWNDAAAFCQWLTESEHQSGRLPPELEYRLPSETEWEYACRGGKAEARFWWGNDWNDAAGRLNAASSDKFPNGKSFQWNCGTEDRWTFVSPVDFYGEKGRNGFGLADMLGNTWEWCLDEADDSSTPEARILRGGAFDAPPGNLRIAGRICDDRSEPCAKYGFRIVCGAVDNPEETVSTSSSTETSAPQFPVWFYNGHYYRLFNECVSWNIAKKRCEEMGGYLVSIETPGENSFIYGNIKTVNGVIFTGATYEANAGVWRWSGSNKKLKFLRWDIGQPVSNKDYAAFSPISRKDRWGSYDGTVSSDKNSGENIFGFICEWENAESANKSLDTKPAAQDENIKDSAAVQTNGLIIKIFTPRKKLANTRHLTLYAVINRSNTKYILCQDKDIGRGSTNIFVLQYPKDITEIGSITLEAETGDCWAPESFIFEFPDNKIWTFTGQVSFVSGKDKILEYNAQPSITFYFTGLKTGTIQTSNPYINKVPDWAPHVKGVCAVKPASSSQAAPAQTAPAATTQTAPPIASPAAAAPAQTASDDLFMRGERRKRFMARYDQDRKRYNETEVREIEELYQAASRQPGSQEILEGFNKLVNKYPQANRAGCALLCMGMRCADRLQAEDYLRRAIADYSDCWYGNGVQVGAYARFYLAGYYRQSGRTQEAEKLYQEIKDKYPDAITPNGKPLANELPK